MGDALIRWRKLRAKNSRLCLGLQPAWSESCQKCSELTGPATFSLASREMHKVRLTGQNGKKNILRSW